MKNCSGGGITQILLGALDALFELVFAPFGGPAPDTFLTSLSYEDIANDHIDGGRLRGRFTDRFGHLVNELNESLMFPIPAAGAMGIPQQAALFDEWQHRQGMSPQLMHADPGPAGSCLSDDLRNMDPGKCTLAAIDDTLGELTNLAPDLAAAFARVLVLKPESLECRPIQGGRELAKQASVFAFYDGSTGFDRPIATRTSPDCKPGADQRLFLIGGEIVQACVDEAMLACKPCILNQDAGPNCDYNLLKSAGCFHPVSHAYLEQHIPANPQVLCRASPAPMVADPAVRCVPRYAATPVPSGTPPERNAMCVPVGAAFADCRPCLDLRAREATAAQRDACLATPPRCHVNVGHADATSCDATFLAADLMDGMARVPTPYRCGFRLPVSRLNVEPDRLNLVLSEAFPCPNGTNPPCLGNDITGAAFPEAAWALWTNLANTANLVGLELAPGGVGAPACYPERNDVLNDIGQDTWLGSPPMGFLGQVVRVQGVWLQLVNSPICEWRPAPKSLNASANGTFWLAGF